MSNVIWELTKSFGPAVIAWVLAVFKARRDAAKEWEKVLKQLEVTKQNNLKVQGRSYKQQFCLRELEKQLQLYEKMISDLNVTIESASRLYNPSVNEQVFTVSYAANIALTQLHSIMFNVGSLESVLKAVRYFNQDYIRIFQKLTSNSSEVERSLHDLVTKISHQMTEEEFKKEFGIYKLTEFEGYLAEMREFILKSITRLFEEMG